jgi:hypothetical protein
MALAGTESTLRITLLGGPRVLDQRYYLLETPKEPRTFAELKSIIKARQQAGLRGIDLLIFENSVARNHSAVKELERWAAQNDLTVSFPPTRGEIP